MNYITVEFTFHGIPFEADLVAAIPFDDLVLIGQDLVDYIEEDSEK